MVNELRELLRETAAHPPEGGVDVAEVLAGGRARVRRRSATVAGAGAATAVAGVVAVTALVAGPGDGDAARVAGDPGSGNRPVGPVLTLADARPATPGDQLREVAALTNDDLDRANGTYLVGATPDGLLVEREGPRGLANDSLVTLVDPATGGRDVLPGGRQQVEDLLAADEDRLVFRGQRAQGDELAAVVYDRADRSWSTVRWDLPAEVAYAADVHDGRLHVGVDTGGEIQRFDLWSLSLTDGDDVRDEGEVVGDFTVGPEGTAWTGTHNEPNDSLTVVDPDGDRRTFDPRSGDRCNQLGMARVGEVVALSQYCGRTGDVRDDRVQVLTDTGEPVVTIQDDGIELAGASDDGVLVTAYGPGERAGTYFYELDSARLWRIGGDVGRFGSGWSGQRPGAWFSWSTAVNGGRGATQHVGDWVG